jgi:hypothetical protein
MRDTPADSPTLTSECRAWSRYLADLEPSPAVVARYLDAHARGVVEPRGSECAFDRALVACARAGPFMARVCDVHARIFRPAGLLRRKLVLALALLETDAQSHARVDEVGSGSRAGLLVACAAWSLRFALIAGLGLLFFLPLRAFCALTNGRGGAA